MDLTSEQATALSLLAANTGRTGISRTTTTQLREMMSLQYHTQLRMVLDDLEDLGLVEMQTNGSVTVTTEGMAQAFALNQSKLGVDTAKDDDNLPRVRAKTTGFPEPTGSPASAASSALPCSAVKPISSVKPSPGAVAPGVHSIDLGRIQKSTQIVNPTKNAKGLAIWFYQQVEEVLVAHDEVRLRPVLVMPLVKHLKDWRDAGVPLETAHEMMRLFLADPSRWLRVSERAPWRQFLIMKDELLKRAKGVDSQDTETWEAWQSALLGVTEEEQT